MRVWKLYSSYARDGEKTVYCQKGKHSVYYGNAFISFKPSKLIWCNECWNSYYQPQPTVIREDLTTNNPEEGTTMEPQPQPKEKVMKQPNLGRLTCTRCEGTGQYSYSLRHGTMCYGCLGTGTKRAKPMTENQVKYIRSLFTQMREAMTIDEQDSLVTKMKAHIDGTNVLTTVWASAAITKLNKLQNERSAS